MNLTTKLIIFAILLFIVVITLSYTYEGFVLTNTIPDGVQITLNKGLQNVKSGIVSGVNTVLTSVDKNSLDSNTYYVLGTLNAAGQQKIADANALALNGGKTCNAFPANVYMKLPATDAVCNTDISQTYDFAADSFDTCTINKNGVLYKQGTLKLDDNVLTLQNAYNGGKTCSQQLPLTAELECGNINAVCKTVLSDVYSSSPDSFGVCTINKNGLLYKQGNILSDSLITIRNAHKSGQTCTAQKPATADIQCGPIDAVCNTKDSGLYDLNVADSYSACNTKNALGVWSKTVQRLPDSQLTSIPAYAGGKTCSTQIPATKLIACGPIDAPCPVIDNTYYNYNQTAVRGITYNPVTVTLNTTKTPVAISKV